MYHLGCFQNKFWESYTVYIPINYNVIKTFFATIVWYNCHCQWFTLNKMFWFYWIYKFMLKFFFCFLAYNLFPHFFSFFKKGSVLFFTGTELNPLYQSYFVLRVIQLRNANLSKKIDIRMLVLSFSIYESFTSL